MHVTVKELSPVIQSALKSVKYGATDIKVVAAEQVEVRTTANDGARGFMLALNLDTGERKSFVGDWGGSGLGRVAIDYTDEIVPLPENGVVIKGSIGWPRTYATIYAHPHAAGAYLLPSGNDETLTDVEQQAIYCFAAIKGGQYRRDEMRRRNVTDVTVDSLVERGYLKRSKNGSTQITTKGKNARTVNY